jgi:hypothetical protein
LVTWLSFSVGVFFSSEHGIKQMTDGHQSQKRDQSEFHHLLAVVASILIQAIIIVSLVIDDTLHDQYKGIRDQHHSRPRMSPRKRRQMKEELG